MFGPSISMNMDTFGLIPRCMIYLFKQLRDKKNGPTVRDYSVTIELLQIYKSKLMDLLNPHPYHDEKLVIKTDFSSADNSIYVQNLRCIPIHSVRESLAVLTEAQSNRIVASHELNDVSSRSHMLVMIKIIQRMNDGNVKTAKLNFGDLAGSEDVKKALGKNPSQERMKESIAISSSLSALTAAISYLSKGKRPGYRDSPLTHILKDSLGGNSKTVMFVNCSPHIYNRSETIRTLRFAATAKKVKNKALINEELSVKQLKKRIKELEVENSALKAQLLETKTKVVFSTRALSRMCLASPANSFHGYFRKSTEDSAIASVVQTLKISTTSPALEPKRSSKLHEFVSDILGANSSENQEEQPDSSNNNKF